MDVSAKSLGESVGYLVRFGHDTCKHSRWLQHGQAVYCEMKRDTIGEGKDCPVCYKCPTWKWNREYVEEGCIPDRSMKNLEGLEESELKKRLFWRIPASGLSDA